MVIPRRRLLFNLCRDDILSSDPLLFPRGLLPLKLCLESIYLSFKLVNDLSILNNSISDIVNILLQWLILYGLGSIGIF